MDRRQFWPLAVLVVAFAVLLVGGKWYLTRNAQPPAEHACTLEAMLCPDGTAVGRVGPNCEFAACPRAADATSTGTLAGRVSVGPICPVERPGVPCPVPPEAYTSREFLVLSSGNKEVASFHADARGNYGVSLPPGVYTVVSAKTGMGFLSKDLPQTITIGAGRTTTLNIDVDTGIR